MFDDLKKPEDIFEKSDNQPPINPALSNDPAVGVPPVAPAPLVYPSLEQKKNFSWKKVLVIVTAVVIVVIAAYFISKFLLTAPTTKTEGVPNVSQAVGETFDNNSDNTVEQPNNEQVATPPVAEEEKDSDKDSLSDVKEISLGTNPNLPDTDNDGLFDREEVEVYRTNALLADTDGDGYKDGEEVKNGYNPNGSGKLFTVPGTN
jgi:hypothetical protein